jgi:hypothetical protein
MDYKILRFYSQDVDSISYDFKSYTYYLKEPIVLKEEYTLTLKQFLFDSYEALVYAPYTEGYRLKDMYIADVNNNDWGATTLGVYRYQDHNTNSTLIFEVYKESSTSPSKARLLGFNDYDFDSDGFPQFLVFQLNAGDPSYNNITTTGYLEHLTLGINFLWYKTTDFKTTPTGTTTPLIPPFDSRKMKLFINDIDYDSEQYISSSKDRSMGAMVAFLERRKTIQMEMGEKYLLTLTPQVITKITLSLEDENQFGINNYKIYNFMNNTFDNFSIVLLLKKKNQVKKKSNLILDKR